MHGSMHRCVAFGYKLPQEIASSVASYSSAAGQQEWLGGSACLPACLAGQQNRLLVGRRHPFPFGTARMAIVRASRKNECRQ